jgi:hemolysin activation/secretion protein
VRQSGCARRNHKIRIQNSKARGHLPRRRQATHSSKILLAVCVVLAHPLYAQTRPGDPIGSFDIARFDVEGNTLLDGAAVQNLVAGYAGKDRDFSFVEHAMDALEAAYRKRGYSLVKVILPEQELDQGVVRLRVVETRVGKVRVEGITFHDEANIRNSLAGLQEGAMPNTDRISASLRIANENPSKKTNLQFQSAAQPGVVDGVAQVVDEKTWNVGVLLDNSGVGPTGRDHVTAQYQNFNLGGVDHVFSAQYTTSFEHPSSISVYGAGYHIPLYALGDSLDFYGSYSNVNSGSVAAGLVNLQISGQGTVFGGHFNHYFGRSGDYDSKLIAGLDHKAFKNDIQLAGGQLGGNVTVDPASLSYTGEWLLPNSSVNFYLTGVHNVPGGTNGSEADFTAARSGATRGYGLLRYGAGYNRALPQDWQLRLGFNGQATHDALVPGEQFGVGGAASVRGLGERELANDQGITANAEIYTPNWCTGVQGKAMQCRALAFYDAGHVSRNQPLPGEETSASVQSAGVGVRVTRGNNLSLQVDYGHVVTASDAQQRGEQRVHARLAMYF